VQEVSRQMICPVCGSRNVVDCVRIAGVPVYCNVLLASRDEALAAPTGDVDLVHCRKCSHLFNAAFDPARVEYSSDYENSLHHSPRFQAYARALAERLVADYDLRGKRIVEIACGQGDFLSLVCELGGSRGIGFDPSYTPGRGLPGQPAANLSFLRAYYTDADADVRADLVCCRHALEHIAQPIPFLRAIRRALGRQSAAVYFEVPDAAYNLVALGVWDLIYEHCGYFTAASLAEAFRRGGFRVTRLASEFGGQYLGIDAVPAAVMDEPKGPVAQHMEPSADLAPVPADLGALVARFAEAYSAKVERWRRILGDLTSRGQRAVLWGAGSKGVSFLNTVGAGAEIACLVDLNPHKHGRFVPGTGHEVCPPESLRMQRPDAVIVMNPLYAEEIIASLRAMGIDAPLLIDGSE
jgi:SAM-dependent methyltransferase